MSATKEYLMDIAGTIEKKYDCDLMATLDYITEYPHDIELEDVVRKAETAAKIGLLQKRGYIFIVVDDNEDFKLWLENLSDLGYTLEEKRKNFAEFRYAGQLVYVERRTK